MGTHDGHRNRMKQEFLSSGLAGFSDVRALELLLFFSRPRGDVNPLAHNLLDAFGSLSGVLDADPELLRHIPGMGENTLTLLKLIPALSAKYVDSRIRKPDILSTPNKIQDLFTPYFFGARNEMSFVACMDNSLHLLGVRKLDEGGPDNTEIGVRQVIAAALAFNASAVILAHNHTSGDLTPSMEDLSTTSYLKEVLDTLNIVLYDHVILSDDTMLSMRNDGFLSTI